MDDNRRVRQDMELVVVTRPSSDGVVAAGRVVAWEDGRWLLAVAVAGRWVEVRGERFGDSRAATLLLLRAAEAA